MPRRFITIQARMGSTRFPGKIMEPIFDGMGSLEIMIRRMLKVSSAETFVLTSKSRNDQEIEDACKKLGVKCFRGNEEDVMTRMTDFIGKVSDSDYDAIVDLTSDCPLVSHSRVNSMLSLFRLKGYEYLSNVVTRTHPDGFDVQIYNAECLIEANSLVIDKALRQHTGWNILNSSWAEPIRIGNVPAEEDQRFPEWGLTLDTRDDLELLRRIFDHFGTIFFSEVEAVEFLKGKLDLLKINSSVKRKIAGE